MTIDLHAINIFLSGAVMLGYFLAGLFFLRFWAKTHDRLFLLFAIAFAMLGLQRFALLSSPNAEERALYVYGFRLAAFLVILWAIVDKNRSGSNATPGRRQRQTPASPSSAHSR